ncbi:MAG TPA: alpha/beta hydrolase [Rhizomicrobium sp.]|nr:alpha/beta hydrolase [Rhizomicrobium sp.]
MSDRLNPEVAAVLAAFAEMRGGMAPPARGDAKALRGLFEKDWAMIAQAAPARPNIQITEFFAATGDGAKIKLKWYVRNGSRPGAAVVYAHGGGMVMLSADDYDFVVAEYVDATGVPFLSVDYRLAPESSGTALAGDTFTGVRWLIDNAHELGVDPARIAIMGDSGGGGVAAGAAIVARDQKILLAQQILIYPMLDDRNVTPDPLLASFAATAWSYDHNFTGWNAVLGDARGGPAVSPVAAPARLTDFSGLAPAYIEVGDLDIFRDEDIAYALGFARAGIPVELHVHPGVPHGYDRLIPNSDLVRRAMADRCRVVSAL